MNNVGKQIAFVVLVVLYMGSSVLMLTSHTHIFYGSFDGQRTIEAHGSSKKGIPGPLPSNHTCISCLLASQFVACIPTHIDVPIVIPSADCVAPAQALHFFASKFSYPKRGPPHILV